MIEITEILEVLKSLAVIALAVYLIYFLRKVVKSEMPPKEGNPKIPKRINFDLPPPPPLKPKGLNEKGNRDLLSQRQKAELLDSFQSLYPINREQAIKIVHSFFKKEIPFIKTAFGLIDKGDEIHSIAWIDAFSRLKDIEELIGMLDLPPRLIGFLVERVKEHIGKQIKEIEQTALKGTEVPPNDLKSHSYTPLQLQSLSELSGNGDIVSLLEAKELTQSFEKTYNLTFNDAISAAGCLIETSAPFLRDIREKTSADAWIKQFASHSNGQKLLPTKHQKESVLIFLQGRIEAEKNILKATTATKQQQEQQEDLLNGRQIIESIKEGAYSNELLNKITKAVIQAQADRNEK